MSRDKALEALFVSLFSAAGLRRFLSHGEDGKQIVSELAEELPINELAHEAVLVLGRYGLIEEKLFHRLVSERPKRHAEINAVATQWRYSARRTRKRRHTMAILSAVAAVVALVIATAFSVMNPWTPIGELTQKRGREQPVSADHPISLEPVDTPTSSDPMDAPTPTSSPGGNATPGHRSDDALAIRGTGRGAIGVQAAEVEVQERSSTAVLGKDGGIGIKAKKVDITSQNLDVTGDNGVGIDAGPDGKVTFSAD